VPIGEPDRGKGTGGLSGVGGPRHRTALALALILAGLLAAAAIESAGLERDSADPGLLVERPSERADRAGGDGRQHIKLRGCDARTKLYRQKDGERRKRVAFGFDDGPTGDTRAFLEILERHHARATFFVLGSQIGGRGRILRDILRRDSEIGSHGLTHRDLKSAGSTVTDREMRLTTRRVFAQTGFRPCVFRPPYGLFDDSTVGVARSHGMATVLWNVDSEDYTLPGSGQIARNVLRGVRPGSIVLMHDGGGRDRAQTIKALRIVLRNLRRRGYDVVTVSQLLGFRRTWRKNV
jgi:peptidoglycan-N-acetylglucosamine deacetylase